MAKPSRPSRKGQGAKSPKRNAFFSPETLQTLHDERDSGHRYSYKFPGLEVVADALRENDGNLLEAAKQLQVSRPTLYDWIEKNPVLKQAREEGEEALLDLAQSKLKELIVGVWMEGKEQEDGSGGAYKSPPHFKSIEFLLRTKGKKRGFVVDNKPARTDGGSDLWRQANEMMTRAMAKYDTQGTGGVQPGTVGAADTIDSETELGSRPGP